MPKITHTHLRLKTYSCHDFINLELNIWIIDL